MDVLKLRNFLTLKTLAGLTLVLLAVTLFFGLKPRGFDSSNGAGRIPDRAGIRFDKTGIAYCEAGTDIRERLLSGSDGFSLDIALKPESSDGEAFRFIFSLHNGSDRAQLVMGQWRSWVIVMNGDDYDNRRKTKRVSVNLSAAKEAPRMLTLSSGAKGTAIYLDGKPVRVNKKLTLNIPEGDNTRLLLGNSVYGRHPWQGDIYGLALYDRVLGAGDAAMHFSRWENEGNFGFALEQKPTILYLFDEDGDARSLVHAKGDLHLDMPKNIKTLEQKFLTRDLNGLTPSLLNIKDFLLNFLGFIPLGFVLTALWRQLGNPFDRHPVLLTVLACFAISLTIEIAQAWIPSRSSDWLDLMLNTGGGLIGAGISLKIIINS